MAYLRKISELSSFIEQEVDLFQNMLNNTTFEVYKKEIILRKAIDKTLNDIILACIDLTTVLLRMKKRVVPKTYKEIILSAYEFTGESALKIAPLVTCRNETIHGYLKLNWENVKVISKAKVDIISYVNKIVALAKI